MASGAASRVALFQDAPIFSRKSKTYLSMSSNVSSDTCVPLNHLAHSAFVGRIPENGVSGWVGVNEIRCSLNRSEWAAHSDLAPAACDNGGAFDGQPRV